MNAIKRPQVSRDHADKVGSCSLCSDRRSFPAEVYTICGQGISFRICPECFKSINKQVNTWEK
jgi:hypothetical protein